eukprot:6188543-Pleurochrysis_carterae.AAC.1
MAWERHVGAVRGAWRCAASAGDVDAIALLLEEGLDPNQRDYDKRTVRRRALPRVLRIARGSSCFARAEEVGHARKLVSRGDRCSLRGCRDTCQAGLSAPYTQFEYIELGHVEDVNMS